MATDAEFRFTLDVPTPPENVRVSDIFKDSCVLHWEAPKDDGGTPLTHYMVEQMDVSSARGAWRDIGEIQANTRTYKVQHLEEKSKYKFRIRALNKIGPSEPADLQDTVLAKDPWGKDDYYIDSFNYICNG